MKDYLSKLSSLVKYLPREDNQLTLQRISDLEQKCSALEKSVHFLLNSVPQFVDASNFEDRLITLLQMLKPRKSVGLDLRRIGGMTDGGYVVEFSYLDEISLLTFGVGDSVRFEEEISKYVKIIYAYDHTVNSYPGNAKVNFSSIGLSDGSGDYESISVKQALAIMSGKIILKMDVEGAEWTALRGLERETYRDITQLIVEFHGLEECQNGDTFDFYIAVLSRILDVFVPVHLNTNNNSLSLYGKNCYVTSCIEVTFLNKFHYPQKDLNVSSDSLFGVNTPFRVPLSAHPLF